MRGKKETRLLNVCVYEENVWEGGIFLTVPSTMGFARTWEGKQGRRGLKRRRSRRRRKPVGKRIDTHQDQIRHELQKQRNKALTLAHAQTIHYTSN